MGVQPVPLDDLLGFNLSFVKLQELLTQLIKSSNDQEAALQLLRDDTTKAQEGFDKRIAEQDEVLARAREQFDASSERLDAAVASVEASKAELAEQAKSIDERVGSVERGLNERIDERVGSVERGLDERLGAIEAEHRDASETLGAAQSGLEALREKLASAEEKFAGAEALKEQERLAAAEQEKALEKRLQEQVNGLSSKVSDQFTSGVEELKQMVHSHDKLLTKLDRDVEQHVAKLESVGQQLAKLDGVEQRLEAFEGSTASLTQSMEGATKRLDDLEGREAQIKTELQEMAGREAAHALSIKKVEEGLRASRADANLRGLIDALSKRFEDDVNPLKAMVDALTGKMNDFLDSGASATANCLCCGGKRATKHDKFVVGTDGKTYFRASNGETVNLGRIPGSGLPPLVVSSQSGSVGTATRRQISPSASAGTIGRRQASPTRAATALGTSASTGTLL